MNSHKYVPRGQHANIPRDKTKKNEKTRHKTAIKYKYLTMPLLHFYEGVKA